MWVYVPCRLKLHNRCCQSPHFEPVNMFKARENVSEGALHLCASQLTASFFFHFSLWCALWSLTGVALAQDNNHISVWSSLSSRQRDEFTSWTAGTGILFCENQHSVPLSTFIHFVWLMLAISPDETVPQQDMIDGSYIPNPYLHQTPKQFISANSWGFLMSLQHTRSSSRPTFLQKYLCCFIHF